MGKVILLGAGPGDVDLLTLKGKEHICKADCIIYDRLASKDILSFAKPGCEKIFVGKENHNHVMKQDDINALLVEKAKECELVVRLKGGDPYVFGRGGEEALYLKQNGIKVDILSGVTSVISVLASAGIPITHRGIAKGFQVITAHSKKDQPSDIDFGQLLDETVTLVFLMGLAHVGQIAEGLIRAGRNSQTPVAVISKGTTVEQRKCIGTLENIAALVEEAGLPSPSIIVVGNVVKLADELSFFENRALFGKTVIVPFVESYKYSFSNGEIPFTESRLVTLLREEGAKTIELKVGQIKPCQVDMRLENLEATDWVLFTSANGIYSFMYNLSANGLDIRSLSNVKIAVVGRKTAEILKEFSITADYIAKEQTAKSLAREMAELVCESSRVLYVSGKMAEAGISEGLSDKCQLIREIFYENIECQINENKLDADYICFTSASSVRRTMQAISLDEKTVAVAIGTSSFDTAVKAGIQNCIKASEASYEGIIDAINRR